MTRSNEFPLPAGWRKAKTSDKSPTHAGRVYFINEVTKETTWVDPRDKLWKKATWAECGPDELPFGKVALPRIV